MSLDEIDRRAISRAGVIRVRTALNPFLWLCAVVTPTCFAAAWALGSDAILRYGLVTLGALPVLLTLAAATYLLARDRDRLQSEDYLIRQLELRMTERKNLPPIPSEVIQADDLPSSAESSGEQG